MLRYIDDFLNNFTMYTVVLYGLAIEFTVAVILGMLGLISFTGLQMLISVAIILSVCYSTNLAFEKLLNAPVNKESFRITALILFFVLAPPTNLTEVTPLVIGSILAMASKYVFAIRKKHLFNPAAIAAFLLGLSGSSAVFWWVGTPYLLPVVLVVGLLIVRKTKSFSLLYAFTISAMVMIIGSGVLSHRNIVDVFLELFISWPLVFFATVMLTEPLTAPPTQKLQIIYGCIVGLLFGAQFQLGPLFSTPELALVVGNIYAYIVSPKEKLFLKLKETIQHSQHMYDFVFATNTQPSFQPGQYMEWTLPHKKADMRGNRRYFTVASSPTEKELHLGVRLIEKGSSFKHALKTLDNTKTIIAAQPAGDFTLPTDKKKKLVFIAGGIGVTPFRSMIQYLMDKKENRDVILLYANSSPEDFIYKEVFDKAKGAISLKTIYTITNKDNVPKKWEGKSGRITEQLVKEEIADYMDRTFYLSGPQAMVRSYGDLLKKLGIPTSQIITDFFPGF